MNRLVVKQSLLMRAQVRRRVGLAALALAACLAQTTTALALEFEFLCPKTPGPQPPAAEIRKAIAELRAAVQEKEAIEEEYHRQQIEEQRRKTGRSDITFGANIKEWDSGDRLADITLALCNLDLRGQDLSDLDFTGFRIDNVDFSRAKLDGAIFSHLEGKHEYIKFSGASLRGAKFDVLHLTHANFDAADLSGARFTFTDISNSDLLGTIVANTYFAVRMTGVNYAPKGALPNELSRLGGLEDVNYPEGGQSGVIQLRDFYQKNGRRDEERKATYAIERNATRHMMFRTMSGTLEGAFRFVAFDLTTGYGLHPGRALWLIFLSLLILTPYYARVIARPSNGDKVDGIYLILPADRIKLRQGAPSVSNLTKVARLKRPGNRAWKLGAYFSLLSAFHVGFRDFNVGNWIARVQKKRFQLEAVGRVRTVSGLQSLLSLYLLAMSLITYFGRPFQ